ncbi:MAG: capsule biosynthesis protein CapA [Pseudomonadota bacterium]|nr:capsule biosynthesis protein CapA [Pseudomonadota bacterium]
MSRSPAPQRHFLFLQGPHGPFFNRLARMLQHAGVQTSRIGFNAGDAFFWPDRESYIPFQQPLETWKGFFTQVLKTRRITDIVLYGDVRQIHAEAIKIAKAKGIMVHVFEEGYLRPYWITYERGGANGHSRLMDMTVDQMRKALAGADLDAPLPPAKWGDMRQHVFYGALYHWQVMFRNRAYASFKPHRDLAVAEEFRLYLRRLLLMPYQWGERLLATARVRRGGFPYHLVLLQLAHDSSFVAHSPFDSMHEFLEAVIEGFANGAPRHHHLVFKAHPLEDGRAPIRESISDLSAKHGVSSRVHFLRGGKLAALLNDARSAVTVNSTAAQQVLWRGMALKVFGRAVYDKPEFVSTQSLTDFFSQPTRPDLKAYKDYRRYLLETSQIGGGFYSARGRRQLLRQLVDMMLLAEDPYDALEHGTAAPRQHLRVVR